MFSYLGLTFFFYKNYQWSAQLIVAEMVICIIARSTAVLGMLSLLKCCGYEKNNDNKLEWRELFFITFAGLIRGAIAFGLVLRMQDDIVNRSVIVTSSLTLVVFTTVFFGSTIGVLGKCLFPDKKKVDGEEEEDDDDVSNYSISNRSAQHQKEVVSRLNELEKRRNEMREKLQNLEEKRASMSCTEACVLYKDRLFETILRPILIFEYETNKIKNAREVFETFRSHAPNLDKMMLHQLEMGTDHPGIMVDQEKVEGGLNAEGSCMSHGSNKQAHNTANLLR